MKSSIILMLGLVLLVGCGKKEKTALAQNYYQLGMLELENGNGLSSASHQALVYIDKALTVHKKPEFYASKAMILFNLGHMQESCTYFKKALNRELSGKLRAEILNNYACVLAALKKNDQALAIWQQLLTDKHYMTPEVALFNQSKIFISQKKFDHGRDCLQKAVDISPQYIDARYYLAILELSSNHVDQAVAELDTILVLAPEHGGALALRNTISPAVARPYPPATNHYNKADFQSY